MSEVNATGMLQLYPGVCSEGIFYPHAHFSRIHADTRADTLLANSLGHRRAPIGWRAEVEAHSFCYVQLI